MAERADRLSIQHICRACGHSTETFLSFGNLPLANGLVAPDVPADAQERFPLTLTFCQSCSLAQLAESIDPEKLFRHYVYFSSNSPSYLSHARTLVRRMIVERSLSSPSRVVEIASNDGYLLQYYRERGIAALGIEPAANIAEAARALGIETICEFFTRDLAHRLRTTMGGADVVHAHNVLAHVVDLDGFVAGLHALLKPDGVIVIEFPYLVDLVDQIAFDTVYHEHASYFSLTALVPLFGRYGLQVFDVERIPVHGGSLRLFVCHRGRGDSLVSVHRMLSDETTWGVGDLSTYRRFADHVLALRPAVTGFLREIRAAGRSIAGYGASAKGAMLLNFCGIGRETLDFVADRSPAKQGLAMPGVALPIFPPDELLRRQPDFALLLAWNFAEEIIEQQAEYRLRGGRFILPVPSPRILPPASGRAPLS